MTRAAFTVFAIALMAQLPSASTRARDQVFRSTSESVVVDVAVQQDGRPVRMLQAPDFEVRDNGVLQTLSDISQETLPIDVTLVVDTSGSVSGPVLASLRRALEAVGAQLRPTDRARVVTFNQRVHEASDFTTGGLPPTPPELASPTGLTSLLDAIALSIAAPVDAGRRALAIVFTDGADTVSVLDTAQVLRTARRGGMAVFVVAVAPGSSDRPAPASHAQFFEQLTEITGGHVTTLQRGQNLNDAFVRSLTEFRASYVLRYTPTVYTPGWHDVQVRVTRSGKYDIRARKGYQR